MRGKISALFVACVMVAFCRSAVAQPSGVPYENPLWTPLEKFDEKRDPAQDLQLAIREAKRSTRRILIDVGGEWCRWCHRLDSLFLRNPDLSQFLHANFVVVKVHYDNKVNKNEKFLSRFPKIDGYPHLFVLEKNGKLLRSQDTAELEEGKGHSREKVMTFLKAWAPKRR